MFFLSKTFKILPLSALLFLFFLFIPKTSYAVTVTDCQYAVFNDGKVIDWRGTNFYFGADCNVGSPATFCDRGNWTFNYHPTCTQINFECSLDEWDRGDACSSTATCSWSQTQCSSADRCDGATGGGGTGYDANGRILAGDCNEAAWDGNPDHSYQACVNGGWYKQCCSAGGYSPTVACSNGSCVNSYQPPVNSYSCSTPPSTTTCDFNKTLNPQCGMNPTTIPGSCLDNFPSGIDYSHTVTIDEFHDSGSGAVCKYNCTDSGAIPGQCGNPVATNNCNSGASYGTCTGAASNTCSTNNGTQSCTYTTYTGGGACNQVACTSRQCTQNNCSSGYGCTSGVCTPNGTSCGDGSCNGSETCSSCSADCGTCGSGCDPNQLTMTVSPGSVTAGNNITFSLSGTQGSTYVGNSFSGGVSCPAFPFTWPTSATCSSNASGTFTWTHNWQNSSSGPVCSKTANYTISPNIVTPPAPVISVPAGTCINPGNPGTGITISWTNNATAVSWVDISLVSDFSSKAYHKGVSGTSTTGAGFNGFSADVNGSPLTFSPNTLYYVRLYNGLHSSTASFTVPSCTGTISGIVWNSLNGDGALDAGEPPVAGIPVCVNPAGTELCATTTATGNPNFSITNVPLGNHTVFIRASNLPVNLMPASPPYDPATGLISRATVPVTLTLGGTVTANFALKALPACPDPVTGIPTGIAGCGPVTTPTWNWYCPSGIWELNPGQTTYQEYSKWCKTNVSSSRDICWKCKNATGDWIQTTGDVHSNTRINAPGGP